MVNGRFLDGSWRLIAISTAYLFTENNPALFNPYPLALKGETEASASRVQAAL
ncbi:hypothetical protein [Synechococcus sp. MIT S9451]|uniref:hypothetical protein n=1 Tax=Synechococcus sp. MIT S9451 TaxID=3082543 RepID=UPI0039B55F7A